MALISKGIQLFYNYNGATAGPGFTTQPEASSPFGSAAYPVIGLQEIGELSVMGAGATRDKIEITTLADDKHVYTDGLIAESEQAGITFKFLFDANEFESLKLHGDWEQQQINLGKKAENLGVWIVALPDGTAFNMKATITDLKLDGAGVSAALTMSMTLTPYEAITLA